MTKVRTAMVIMPRVSLDKLAVLHSCSAAISHALYGIRFRPVRSKTGAEAIPACRNYLHYADALSRGRICQKTLICHPVTAEDVVAHDDGKGKIQVSHLGPAATSAAWGKGLRLRGRHSHYLNIGGTSPSRERHQCTGLFTFSARAVYYTPCTAASKQRLRHWHR